MGGKPCTMLGQHGRLEGNLAGQAGPPSPVMEPLLFIIVVVVVVLGVHCDIYKGSYNMS
jgi:hypothetical protein